MSSLSSSRASARYKRAGMQRHRAARPLFDFLQDAVAVAFAVGQGEQNLEGDRRQGKKGFGPELVHVCRETILPKHIDGGDLQKVATRMQRFEASAVRYHRPFIAEVAEGR